jgi:hypothetical protein
MPLKIILMISIITNTIISFVYLHGNNTDKAIFYILFCILNAIVVNYIKE